MTLKKLLFVNTALLSVEDGHDFNATPTEVSKTILMLLLHVMTTLIKLICVNTALFSITYQDGESLAVVDEQDFNVTPAGDDDVLKVILVQYSCFTTN